MPYRSFLLSCLIVLASGCAQQVQQPSAPKTSGTTGQSQPMASSAIVFSPRSEHTTPSILIKAITNPELAKEKPTTLTERIAGGMQFAHNVNNDRVDQYIDWYRGNQTYLDQVMQRAPRYLHYIVDELENREMPLELALLPIVESAYNPFAYSHSHASGIWQFIPGTGAHYGLRRDWWYDGRRDVIDATQAALDYLSYLHGLFDGDWLLALAAYNSGEGNVQRSINANKRRGRKTDYWSLKLPRETRNYVPQLIAIAKVFENPEAHGMSLPAIPDEPYFNVVAIPGQIDLAAAARLADISVEEIYQLNPGYNRWATSPQGPHRLLLPVEAEQAFRQNLKTTPKEKWQPAQRYVVKRGDTLGRIAINHKVSVADIRQTNQLTSDLIRQGQVLNIPGTGINAERPHPFLARVNRYHRVKSGDTLWDISKQYQVSMAQLAAWNGLSTRSILRPGQKLALKGGQAKNEGGTLNYQVKRGDSLYQIARRFRVKIGDLLSWNNLSPEDYLLPGQQLTIYR